MEQGLWIAVLALATALITACVTLVRIVFGILLKIIDQKEATIALERKRADEAGKQASHNFELALQQLRLLLDSSGHK